MDGVSGYEIVSKDFPHRALPFYGSLGIACPNGKKVLGAGVLMEYQNADDVWVKYGDAPNASVPNGASWTFYYVLAAVPGATHWSAELWATCATTTP